MKENINVLGIDCGCTKMILRFDSGKKIYEKKVATGRNISKQTLLKHVNEFLSEISESIDAIGVGIAGLVKNNTMQKGNLFNLEGLSDNDFTLPTFMINDVKAGMVFEEQFYDEKDTIALIMAGSGLALTVKTNGSVIVGANDFAGEIGSSPCLINGCVEKLDDISGGDGILGKAGVGIDEFIEKLEKNDKKCCDIINQAGYYLGLELASIIHTFNPKHIIIGGGCTRFKGYLETAINTAKSYTLPQMFADCTFVAQKERNNVVLGATRFARLKYNKEC